MPPFLIGGPFRSGFSFCRFCFFRRFLLFAANIKKQKDNSRKCNIILALINRLQEEMMNIAIPLTGGSLSPHFGHCEEFVLFKVDDNSKKVIGRTTHKPPVHEPGAFPRWLHGLGANVIIAAGMGSRAQNLFTQNDISVVVGAPADIPEKIIGAYLNGELQVGGNLCDH